MPQLNKETRELLLSTAYAEREVNGRDGARVATAIELLIEWNDRAQNASNSPERVARLEKALQPFRSGGDWGSVKAWIVGKGLEGHGTKVAKRITEWQTAVDEALAGVA